jgi:hypothetical protein
MSVPIAYLRKLLSRLSSVAPTLSHANGAGRAFELLTMFELADEMKGRGWNVRVMDSAGSPISRGGKFIQRGGKPSGVWPASYGSNGPSYIYFATPQGSCWEVWNGVQFIGRSGARHEFDVSIVPHSLGDAMRALPTPRSPVGHGLVSIECKQVEVSGSLDEVRAFVARVYDTTILSGHRLGFPGAGRRIYASPSAGFGTSLGTFREDNLSSFGAIVRASGFTSGADILASAYFVSQYASMRVGGPSLTDFRMDTVSWIERFASGY